MLSKFLIVKLSHFELLNFVYLCVARTVGNKQRSKLRESGLGRVRCQFQPLATKCAQVKSIKLGPVQLGTPFLFRETRKPVMLSTRRQSSAVICAAALVSLVHFISLSLRPFFVVW